MGRTDSRALVTLEKDIFTVGEKIKVTIDCDNTDCSKDVESFSLKL